MMVMMIMMMMMMTTTMMMIDDDDDNLAIDKLFAFVFGGLELKLSSVLIT